MFISPIMTDPLAEVVTLLQPSAPFSKIVNGAGRWRIRRHTPGQTFYCAILEGSTLLTVSDGEPIALQTGDFVLIPSAQDFAMSSLEAPAADDSVAAPLALANGEYRLGLPTGPADVRYLVGHCVFATPDAALLVSLLPQLIHVRDEPRLTTLVQLLGDECRARRPAREIILLRLLEVLFVEALRSSAGAASSPGLLRGLADERLAEAIRRMHENPAQPWTVAQLAKAAALSRSAFFERFSRVVGMAPMEYLLAWRMGLAKKLLLQNELGMAEVAERVGYSSATTFSVAFTRHMGLPPKRYSRELTGSAFSPSLVF